MNKKIYFIQFSIMFALLLSINSFADRRYFGRLYLANSLPKGAFELEFWNTARIGKYDGFYYRFQPRMEFEYGVTDRLTASLYFNFDQVKSENNSFTPHPFEFSSTSFELKYRFTNPGDAIVDPAAYFEFSYGGDEIEYESKLIFSKRIGRWITAVNFTSEIEREIVNNEMESKFEIAVGAMYDISSSLALGMEFRNHRSFTEVYKNEINQATFIGPTINYQAEKFYLTVNVLKQISGSPATNKSLDLFGHENYEFRTNLGVSLD